MRERKTDRVYGAVFNRIREVAAQGGVFTVDDIVGRVKGTRESLQISLWQMASKGELIAVEQGLAGGSGRPAKYVKGKLRGIWKRKAKRVRVRVNRRLPELAGLSRVEYRQRYYWLVEKPGRKNMERRAA